MLSDYIFSICIYKNEIDSLKLVSQLIDCGATQIFISINGLNSSDTSFITNLNEKGFEEAKTIQNTHTLIYVQNESNIGYGAAHNQILKYKKSFGSLKYLVLCNSDIEFLNTDLQAFLSRRKLMKEAVVWPCVVGIIGGKPRYGLKYNRVLSSMHWSDVPCPKLIGEGSLLVVRFDSFEKEGGFNEDFFLYWEEVELQLRMGSGAVDPDFTIVHKSVGLHSDKTKYFLYYNTRNSLLICKKAFPLALLWVVPFKLIFGFKYIKNPIRRWYFIGLLDGLLGKNGKCAAIHNDFP